VLALGWMMGLITAVLKRSDIIRVVAVVEIPSKNIHAS